MPKSKRNKQIELSKTKKRGLEWKKHLFEEIRNCIDSFTNVFVFSVNDMRNSKMKNVREQWKHSRFFIGKNKIMAMALGRFSEEEYKPNLHKLGQQLKGQCGLLFSNKSMEEVLNWFRSYSEGDYARSGNVATEEVKLSAGPLPQFPHNLEPYLRQLGLPTSLVKGVIHLVKDHEVCKSGDILSPETAKILKLLGYEMAEFHITIECVWSQDGSFIKVNDKIETDTKENAKPKRKSNQKKKKTSIVPDVVEMEIAESNSTQTFAEVELACDDAVLNTQVEEISPIKNVNPVTAIDNENVIESVVNTDNNFKSTPKNKISIPENNPLQKSPQVTEEKEENISEQTEDNRIVEKNIKESQEDKDISERQSRPRKRKIKTLASESLQKTPDIANSSQDSPIFRQLRNRSVKVSKKKKPKAK